MPAKYETPRICFQYPDNWTLDEEETQAGHQSVTVYSPGGAFWSVVAHPPSADPVTLARAAVDAMREEYPELEVEDAREVLAGRELVGHDLSFYFLDLINSAWVRCLRTQRTTYTVFCQGEDREFDGLRDVFRAMTISLLNEMEPLGRESSPDSLPL